MVSRLAFSMSQHTISTPASLRESRKAALRESLSSFAIKSVAAVLLQRSIASWSFGRSLRMPDSTST
jgi:hypothetical protein